MTLQPFIYSEQKILPFPPDFLFDLVADVGAYSTFLPWCHRSIVHDTSETHLNATLFVGNGLYSERFTSHVILDAPHRIKVHCESGPFQSLENKWYFEPYAVPAMILDDLPSSSDASQRFQGTKISFDIKVVFKNELRNHVFKALMTEATKIIIRRFETRARTVFAMRK